MIRAQPFLKWVGGKRQLLPELVERVPKTFGRYFEPFVGGGALLFHLISTRRDRLCVIGDANKRLVRTYRAVRDQPSDVIDLLQTYRYEKDFYYVKRLEDPDVKTDAALAAWFVYLNRTCFNGMYRVNKAGDFNVPFGKYTNPTICDIDALCNASRALAGVDTRVGDFELTLEDAREGDFVYCDPPYVPLSATSNFTGYNSDGFGLAEQIRLRDAALILVQRGVHILLSNSSAPLVRELYKGRSFRVEEVAAKRAINSVATKRGVVKELLISGRL